MPMQRPPFAPGTNVAMKIPRHLFQAMVEFYEATLGREVTRESTCAKVRFGGITLWLDEVPTMTQPELWLELVTPDLEAAATWLQSRGAPRCDEVEPLPDDFPGFWVAGPGGTIHLVRRPGS